MQMFMDSPDWLKGIVPEDMGRTYTSSSPSSCDHLISCSKPPALEKRLRPPHDQALKCPRCESTHTKFCYYNNYSLSQPRYFCKTCRRYWTKGGTLRNVPVGGGCRKNKRSSAAAKKAPDHLLHSPLLSEATSSLRQPCFPLVQLPPHVDFMECKYNDNILLLENSADCLHLMDTKLSAGIGEPSHGFGSAGLHDVNSTGFTIDGNHCALMDACQRLALPFEGHKGTDLNAVEVKPGQNERLLSMEWPAADVGSEAIAFSNHGLGLWAGLMNGHGSSAV